MCKTQIEVLNGKIEVESQPGEGATFRLIFPVTN
jgi:chemotaxis protein histidine kinase CheA